MFGKKKHRISFTQHMIYIWQPTSPTTLGSPSITSFFICSFIFIASGILLHGRFMIRLHQSQIKVKSIGKIWITVLSAQLWKKEVYFYYVALNL
jgi:hypothetical protein